MAKKEMEIKIAIKSIRLARLAIESYVDYVEAGKGGPIEEECVPEISRIKAEVNILLAVIDEVLARKREAG